MPGLLLKRYYSRLVWEKSRFGSRTIPWFSLFKKFENEARLNYFVSGKQMSTNVLFSSVIHKNFITDPFAEIRYLDVDIEVLYHMIPALLQMFWLFEAHYWKTYKRENTVWNRRVIKSKTDKRKYTWNKAWKSLTFTLKNSENLIVFIYPHETTTQFKITSLVCVRIELTTLALLAPRSTYWANRPTISNV